MSWTTSQTVSKESGLLQPLTVRRLGANQYELIAGERRLRACRIAGFKTVSRIVNDCDEKQSAIYAMLKIYSGRICSYLKKQELPV